MELGVLDREVSSMGEAARMLAVASARLRGWVDGYSRAGVLDGLCPQAEHRAAADPANAE